MGWRKNDSGSMVLNLTVDPADDPAGIPHCQRIVGNILIDDASGADHASVPDAHPRKDDNPSAKPAAVSDPDGQGIGAAEIFPAGFRPVRREPFRQFYGVGGGIELHVGCDQHVIPDFDPVAVHEGTVHVDGYVVPQVNIAAIIADKGLPYGYVCADLPEEPLQDGAFFLLLFIGQGMVVLQKPSGILLII